MEAILTYWYVVFLAVIAICIFIVYCRKFFCLSDEEKYEKVHAWLLQAVLLAEKEYGGKTGKLKLSVVYSAFCEQLPWLAKVVPFEIFSEWVDAALVEMRALIESNKVIAHFVGE